MKKERLDKILVDLNYFDNKSKAAAAILAGNVRINGEIITKAGFQLDSEKKFEVEIKSMPYVSRGGFKLKKALDTFDVKVNDRICLDAGASTGGFTDCLLQNGAKKVYAADVGYGQIAWKIRNDSRVKVIEKTNLRTCSYSDIYGANHEIADLLVMDVSFISIEKILPNLLKLLPDDFYELICLIKPQFEAGKEIVDKGNGVIKDKDVHVNVINNVISFVLNQGLFVNNLTYSSIKGPSGNIEYLIHLSKKDNDSELSIENIVEDAFLNLN